MNYSDTKKDKLLDEINKENQFANKKWVIEKIIELDNNAKN